MDKKITEDLREYIDKNPHYIYSNIRTDLLWIADNIDKEYDKIMSNSWLSEHDLVRLPVDSEGIPIHIGDKVEKYIGDDDKFTVTYMQIIDNPFCSWSVGGRSPTELRHQRPSPAERIREVARRIDIDAGMSRKMAAHVQRDLQSIANELEAVAKNATTDNKPS